jgi:hypothetical protein
MSVIDDLQNQIDEIILSIEETDSKVLELSDNTDNSVSDINSTLDENQSAIDELTQNSGQLVFPLNQDTIDLIKEQFPSGFTSPMVAGVATVTDPRISTTSNIFYSVATPGGTQGHLSYAATAGQVVFTSTSNTETSILSYLILN